MAFEIDSLDHVALRVRDLETAVAWYEEVLGLKKYQLEQWGPFPIFMMAGTCGVALFPAHLADPVLDRESRNVRIDHFAFHVRSEDFSSARKHFDSLGLEVEFQDHHYFHSLYLHDPDGHTVELTTLVVDPDTFYSHKAD